MKNNLSGPQFLAQLEKRLRPLPKEEREEALRYYAEFLEEGSPGELDTVEETARQILGQCAAVTLEKVEKKEKTGDLKTLWIVILAVFAAPLALPLTVAAVVTALAVLTVVLALVLAVAVTGAALVLGGLGAVILAAFAAASSPVNMLMSLGLGLGMAGVGMLALIAMFYLGKGAVRLSSLLLGKLLSGRRNGNA